MICFIKGCKATKLDLEQKVATLTTQRALAESNLLATQDQCDSRVKSLNDEIDKQRAEHLAYVTHSEGQLAELHQVKCAYDGFNTDWKEHLDRLNKLQELCDSQEFEIQRLNAQQTAPLDGKVICATTGDMAPGDISLGTNPYGSDVVV